MALSDACIVSNSTTTQRLLLLCAPGTMWLKKWSSCLLQMRTRRTLFSFSRTYIHTMWWTPAPAQIQGAGEGVVCFATIAQAMRPLQNTKGLEGIKFHWPKWWCREFDFSAGLKYRIALIYVRNLRLLGLLVSVWYHGKDLLREIKCFAAIN
jgi:hypothetical protein